MPVKKLSLPGKEYFCFQKDGKSAHAAQCAKSRVSTKVIDTIIEIDSFDHQCVILTGLLQSKPLNQHNVIIGADQSLSNSVLYEQRYCENTKKLYKYDGNCDYQQQYEAILEAAMVSTPEGYTDSIPL